MRVGLVIVGALAERLSSESLPSILPSKNIGGSFNAATT
jgi:hypothetical protein